MEYKNKNDNKFRQIFEFNHEVNWKTISMLALLAILPNLLGMINTSVFGVKIHFFQYLVFLAAIIYGPLGGAVSGAFGSVYTAVALNNPYIIIGNIILGVLVGVFVRLKLHVIIAVLLAYAMQLPWLWYSDIYLAGMPIRAVQLIVVALFLSNVIWGFVAWKTHKKVSRLIIN
ncbi:MAG: hypothetical protein Q8O89_05740 [Nanoarchaeota archaeon]|nr:hypothetical protein [Nanoarchaeota archaeon]